MIPEGCISELFCIDRFDSGCFRMSYEFVSISALRTILSVSSHNYILKLFLDCAGSWNSKSNSDSDFFFEVELETQSTMYGKNGKMDLDAGGCLMTT